MIELIDVGKTFGDQIIFSGLNLAVAPGTSWCIVGRSGVGKSQLMKQMIGLSSLTAGDIRYEGLSIQSLTPSGWRDLRDQFGVVFQGAALFDSLTVRENIGMKADEERQLTKEQIDQAVIQALELVDLSPNILGQTPETLSGGMQKRVGIARAIFHRPTYLFYDEPTTGLDPVSSQGIDQLMATLAKDPSRTSIIITHDLNTVRRVATHVVMLGQQRSLFQGPVEAFLTSSLPEIQAFVQY